MSQRKCSESKKTAYPAHGPVQAVRSAGNRRPGICPWLLSLPGALFLLWYIKGAAEDVVYSDYIRLVNAYLPDPLRPSFFFTPDILTRIPITYLFRWINVVLFHYSLTFDRILGAAGLVCLSVTVLRYVLRERLGVPAAVSVFLIIFSLNKWEMLLNGSGYAHFLAFALFYFHFYLLEKLYTGTAGAQDRRLLYVLPWIGLLTAGPYLAVYSIVLLLAFAFMRVSGNRNASHRSLFMMTLSAILPLCLYFLSNHYAEYEYAGAADVSLFSVLTGQAGFSLHFLLNGFASMILGGETLERLLGNGTLSYTLIYVLGAFAAFTYVLAAVLYFKGQLYRITVFPMLLLLHGLGNHAIVFLSRYIFLKETYAWQSRYALQYESAVLGAVLIFFLYVRERKRTKRDAEPRTASAAVLLAAVLTLTFLLGNCYTTCDEIVKMPYREAHFREIREAALNYTALDDETLQTEFEYRHDAALIRKALALLEESHLNVYYEHAPAEAAAAGAAAEGAEKREAA